MNLFNPKFFNILENNNIFDIITSFYAIIIYLVILLVLLIVIILTNINNKTKNMLDTQLIESSKPQKKPEEKSVKQEENKEEVKKETKERFYQLSQIDKNKKRYIKDKYENKACLEEICENFRNYAASVHKLYYDILDIRRFIASLSVTHLLILQGMSGTGKTSLAYAFGKFVENTSTVVPIQPMWKERTDLIGYYNEFTKRFNETVLLQKLYEANYSKDIYITVLDEMNIARVEYYFAEFLSLLEIPDANERYLDVV